MNNLKDLYKFNGKNSGHALFLKANKDFRKKTLQFLFHIVKQSSWDDKTKTGSCAASLGDETKEVYVKMSQDEIATMIAFLEGKPVNPKNPNTVDFFHKNDNGSTQISLTKNLEMKMYSLSVRKNSATSFFVPITIAEAVGIRIALEYYLTACCQMALKNSLEYQQKRMNQARSDKKNQ